MSVTVTLAIHVCHVGVLKFGNLVYGVLEFGNLVYGVLKVGNPVDGVSSLEIRFMEFGDWGFGLWSLEFGDWYRV